MIADIYVKQINLFFKRVCSVWSVWSETEAGVSTADVGGCLREGSVGGKAVADHDSDLLWYNIKLNQ